MVLQAVQVLTGATRRWAGALEVHPGSGEVLVPPDHTGVDLQQ